MSETKQSIKAKLELIGNLYAQIQAIQTTLPEELGVVGQAALNGMKDGLFSSSKAYHMLEVWEALDKMEDGVEFHPPHISVNLNDIHDIEVTIPVSDHSNLVAYTSQSDLGTMQVGTMLYEEDFPIDLSLVEIKKGDLAVANGLSEDNMDIDLMVWGDPDSEDYTTKQHIKHSDIERVIYEKTESEDFEYDD